MAGRNRPAITICVLLLIFLLRIPHLNNATVEIGDYWRQSDTESIAVNFIEKRFNIFYPQMNYDGSSPNYVQLELQLTTFIIAILYKLFGHHYWLARLVPTSFFILSAYYLYLIEKRTYSSEQAWSAALIYGTMPVNLFFSRTVMPESALLCFFTGAYYYFLGWIENEKFSRLLAAAVFTMLAISQKLPAVFIGLAMLAICIERYKGGFILRWDLWLFAAISLLPNLVYYLWSYSIAESKFVSHIGNKYIFPKFYSAFLTPQALEFYEAKVPEAFGYAVLFTALAGFFIAIAKKENYILFWFVAMVLEVLAIVSPIRFEYYLMMLGPVIALLSGRVIGLPWKRFKLGYIITLAIILAISYNAYKVEQPEFKEVQNRLDGAEILKAYTNKDDLIVIGTFDPAVLSLSGRNGWRTGSDYHDYKLRDPNEDIKYYIRSGAKYFLLYRNWIYGDKGGYYKYVDNNFQKVCQEKDFTLYKLQ
ncbi:MAG: ArnT family glycosyltransferase [Caulobacteraceae bacterium]